MSEMNDSFSASQVKQDVVPNLRTMFAALKRPIPVLVMIIVAGLGIRLVLADIPGYRHDIYGWSRLAQNAVDVGLPHVYDPAVFDVSLGVYPPLYHAALSLVGLTYQRFYSSDFVLNTAALNALLKLVPIFGECLLSLAVYFSVRHLAGERMALWSAVMFSLNPAVLFTSAYWGMFGDSLYTLCIVISLLALQHDKPVLACIVITLGVLFKPQTLAFVPLVFWWSFRPFSVQRGLNIVAGIGLTGVLVWLPFVMAGTIAQAIAALQQSVDVYPMLSVAAHNVWYLVGMGDGAGNDAMPFIGPLSARMVGLAAFAAAYLLVLRRPAEERFSLAAYVGFAFIMLSTQMHENYSYPAVVLLTICWRCSRTLKVLAVVITLTALANMLLHDPSLNPAAWLSATTALNLTLLNAVVNGIAFIVWTGVLLRSHPQLSDRPGKRQIMATSA
jgi:Gpi18-like mannosyltransferase